MPASRGYHFQAMQHERGRGRSVNRRSSSSVLTGIMVVVAAYFLLPMVWLGVASTKNAVELFGEGMWTVGASFWTNLTTLATYDGGAYWRWYINSVIYSVLSCVLGVLVCSMTAYALAKHRFRLAKVTNSLVLVALLVPTAALNLPLFLVMRGLHLLNTYAAVILPAIPSAFGVYFLRTYIVEALPQELMEAARIDGASDVRTFFWIAVPIIRPGLVTFGLIHFVAAWNNFYLPLLMINDAKLYPLTVGLNQWATMLASAGQTRVVYGILIMAALLSILPMMALMPFARKYIAGGALVGSVKS